MSDTHSIHSSPHTHRLPRPRFLLTRPMFQEGLISPLLLVALVTVAGLSVEAADWARIVTPIALVAAVSATFGSVIAKLRVLDSLAHMVSMLLAFVVSAGLVLLAADQVEGGTRDRLREIGRTGLDWYLGEPIDDTMEALLVSLLMGIIVWLVGYLAAWSMFRRGWVLSAVLLPGFLILVNLGYAEHPQTGYLAAFVFLAFVLVARHHLFARQQDWRRRRLASPAGLAQPFVMAGLVVSLVATGIGWRAPDSLSQETLQPLVGKVSDRALSLQDQATDWLDEVAGTVPSGSEVSGSYTQFGESFAVGGPLELSDTPQVVVFADDAPYLTAQHYDSYSGRGWFSTTEDTFNAEGEDGRRYSPAMTFASGQEVPLSDGVTGARTSTAVEITPLVPMGGRMLTVDTYQSSSVQSAVRMSWIQMQDAEFDIANGDPSQLPRDLNGIAALLSNTDLSGDQGEFGPLPADSAQRQAIEGERRQLQARFLDVRWTADERGEVQTLIVTGQAPVYDDVESVSSNDPAVVSGTYRVIASTSTATPDDLSGARTAYPGWVRQRYLSLPDTITPRTVDLAQEVVAGAGSPYEMARAIEKYLRSNYVYDETVEAPPEDADIVDYFLFERERGYCEYYASAMTVMLRALGVPARVSVGFYPGDYDEGEGGYLYRQVNAHAWTEVYFPGYGWIPFEPTAGRPLIDEGVGEAESPVTPEPTGIAIEETPTLEVSTPDGTPVADANQAGTVPPQPTAEDEDGSGARWLVAAGVGIGLAAVAALAWMLWIVPLRGMSAAGGLFARLRRIGRWVGVSPAATVTPREYGKAFSERVPQAGPHVDRIVRSYELDQYGPDRAGPDWLAGAEQAWRSIRRSVPRWVMRWRR